VAVLRLSRDNSLPDSLLQIPQLAEHALGDPCFPSLASILGAGCPFVASATLPPMIDWELLLETISARSGEIVDFTRELVAIPTENPPGRAYPECVASIERRLADLGLPVELVELAPDRTAVISCAGHGPTFYLHGHYDVVPASVPGQFVPAIQGTRLRGRGSADMKAGIASMVFALAALSATELAGRVELVLVPDEETGGELGSRRLLELGRLGRKGVGAIVGEPTSGVIWNAHRGAITVRVSVTGRGSHVGLQHRGVNAFEAAIPILSALAELKEEVEQRRTSFHVKPEAARASILMLGGEVRGGHQFNVVPERFSFSVERRFNPEEELEVERARLLAVIDEAAPPGVDVRVLQEGGSSRVVERAGLVGGLQSAIQRVTGDRASCELCPGLLESRFYAAAGVPAVAYGPGELEVAHGPHESVELERLTECAQIYALTAVEVLAGMGASPGIG
jgi:succinyl-diaminopimelate desuccinylase